MQRFLYMAGLILAGEAVFALPFHVTRFFRPAVLDVFQLTNTELGAAQAVYGVCAMLAYFPGGPLADRFPARKLLAFSLWTTAAGGLYMAAIPDYAGALILWGFFGITTILFFWAALIRATRDWGGSDEQGRAYGLLDGGRGLLAAGLASIAVVFFGLLFPEGTAAATAEEREAALVAVIYGYTIVTALAGVFVWFVLPDGHPAGAPDLDRWRPGEEGLRHHIGRVLAMPVVWLQAAVVVCAYVAYKGFDNYSLYAVQVYGMSDVEAARLVAVGAWLRPVAALGAGFLGDRYGVARMCLVCFVLLLGSFGFLALDAPGAGAAWVLLGNVLVTSAAMFGLRGLYFALLEETGVPDTVTGTAVGLVSVIGFTPDIFVAYVGGILLDASPGLAGHRHYFTFLAAFAAAGIAASAALVYVVRRRAGLESPPGALRL
jgi:nitrate/nitrite transporter NarK